MPGPLGIALDFFAMLTPIQFNNELGGNADEIRDIWAYRDLAAKLGT